MKQVLRYFRTLAHLRPLQLGYLLLRRYLPQPALPQPSVRARRRSDIHMLPAQFSYPPAPSDATFSFLNRTKEFPEFKVDWASPEMPKLWRYNLHYFDYLQDPQRSYDSKCALLTDWIRSNDMGTPDAWEPYTLSLRIVNWIKFFLSNPSAIDRPEWIASLHQQAIWLEHHIEYHLLANHLLKNGVALYFAGTFLDGRDADRWRATGLDILTTELQEQFLPDGGHFERSPMYHNLCVLDYLDVLNLITHSNRTEHQSVAGTIRDRITLALQFLEDLCFPDGEIPLFNDSAFGIAPAPAEILRYAGQILPYEQRPIPQGLTVQEKSSTGYFVVRDGADMMAIDCGEVGPAYQPGHAHADTLNFELAIDGQRIIVDSGVYDYEPGPRRVHARSTKAHNTLRIDQQDQSETWGVFRVARRARPIMTRLTLDGRGRATFNGAHNGYVRLPGRLIHKRQIVYAKPGEWTVCDTVEGAGFHSIESYLHIHPAYTVRLTGDSGKILDGNEHAVLTFAAEHYMDLRCEPGFYFPEFGMELANTTVTMTYAGMVPVTLTYRLIKPLPSIDTDQSLTREIPNH